MSFGTFLKSLATFGASQAEPRPVIVPEYRSIATTIAAPYANKPIWPDRTIDTYDVQAYRKLGLIFAAVTMTAEAIASGTVRVYDEANDNESVANHPLRSLMKRPNEEQEESEFLSSVAMIMAIAGFCVVEKERSAADRTVALWPLRSDWLRPILRDQAPPDWEYRIPGRQTPVFLDARDVMVFRYANRPDRSPFGIGPLEVCLREVGLLNELTNFIKGYLESGMVPMYGIIPEVEAERMDQPALEEWLDNFVRRRGGVQNANRPLYMEHVKDIKRLGMSMDEIALPALHDLSDLAIAQAFRIPASMLQIRAGLEHSDSRANAEVDEAKFYRQTITPLWRRMDGILTLGLLSEFEPPNSTRSLEFDTSKVQALQDDRNAKAGWLVDGGARGVFSVQTVHRELGLPVPDGDDFYLRGIATDAVPIDDPFGETLAPQLPPPSLAPTPDKALPATTRMSPNGHGELRVLPTDYDDAELRNWKRLSPVERRAAHSRVNRKLIGRIADRSEPSIRAFLQGQGKRLIPKVTDGLRAAPVSVNGTRVEVRAMEDIDWGDENKRLKAVTDKLHVLAGKTAFDAIEQTYGIDIGIAFDLANPHVKDVVDRLGTRVTGINETTRDSIASKVSSGLQDGKSLTEIADSLAEVFESRSRAETVARTESMVAFGSASTLGFRESGVVDRIQCFDNPDHVDSYDAEDGLSCSERDGFVDDLDSAELHIRSEHPNGSLVLTPVLTGETVD